MLRRLQLRRGITCALLFLLIGGITATYAQPAFSIRQIADETQQNRSPVISETGLVAWYAFRVGPDAPQATEIFIHQNGQTSTLTTDSTGNNDPQVDGNSVVWVASINDNNAEMAQTLVDPPIHEENIPEMDRRYTAYEDHETGRQWFEHVAETNIFLTNLEAEEGLPQPERHVTSGHNEIILWNGNEIHRLTTDNRNDLGPAIAGNLVAWQKARGWPFGWEIILWANGQHIQLTTNLYYDMAPRIHGNQIVWYGWDGNDYEIFHYNHDTQEVTQLTDNKYDDMSPQLWDNVVVWEAHASIFTEIMMWKDGETTQLSQGNLDNTHPRIWNGQVVWQASDGNFSQIYYYDGTTTTPLTQTRYDNVQPDIRDGIVTWMGYVENMDAEIFVWVPGSNQDPIQLTDNEYDDLRPLTAGGRIVWQAAIDEKSYIYLAEPQ